MERFCPNKTFSPPIIDEPQNFSSNYETRIYLSACYYLNSNYQWQSDGLLVRFLDIVVISNFYSGWSIDKSLSNTMFVYIFNKIFECFSLFTKLFISTSAYTKCECGAWVWLQYEYSTHMTTPTHTQLTVYFSLFFCVTHAVFKSLILSCRSCLNCF